MHYLFDFGQPVAGVNTGSMHWWYTSRDLFPFLYDFTLNSWLYYSPDVNNTQHYTSNPRFFFDFNTMTLIYL